jgi:hypothetical protein
MVGPDDPLHPRQDRQAAARRSDLGRRDGADNASVSSSEPDRVSLLLGTYLFEDLSPAEIEPVLKKALLRRSRDSTAT